MCEPASVTVGEKNLMTILDWLITGPGRGRAPMSVIGSANFIKGEIELNRSMAVEARVDHLREGMASSGGRYQGQDLANREAQRKAGE